MSLQQPLPLTRADLEEIARKWGQDIEELWAALRDEEPADDGDDAA